MALSDNKMFSLRQMSDTDDIVIFEKNSLENLIAYIQNVPKHGQRIVAIDLDDMLIPSKKMIQQNILAYNPDIIDTIKILQAARCLLIGFTQTKVKWADHTIDSLLKEKVDFNYGCFENIYRPYISRTENGLFKKGIMFVSHQKKNDALKALMRAFDINSDDVYFMAKGLTLRHQCAITNDADDKMPLDDEHEINNHIMNKSLKNFLPSTYAHFINEIEWSHSDFKIKFKQQPPAYKPYAYFWGSKETDYVAIQYFLTINTAKEEIKKKLYNFSARCDSMAYRFKIPLEKAAALVGFLYGKKVLKAEEAEHAKVKLAFVEKKISRYKK